MDKKTKKARKLMELKRLVLNSNGVRRSEAAKLVDLDIRTASAYLEELAAGGLLRSELEAPGGRGRPGILYYPNRENLCYPGLVISADLAVSLSVLDCHNQVLTRETIRFDRANSKLTVFRKVLELIRRAVGVYPDRRPGAIGIAISRWLQPPLASYDLYSGLVNFLNREMEVPVYREVNINMLAFQASVHYGCRNLAFIHPGKVLEFGLVINGFPAANLFEHEDWLAHLPLNPDGRKCYCGQRGCLENYVTEGAIAERLRGLGVNDSPGLSADIERYMGMACRKVAAIYNPEAIVLRIAAKHHAGISDAYGQTGPKLYFNHNNPGVEEGAAMLASFLSTRQFIKEPTGEHGR